MGKTKDFMIGLEKLTDYNSDRVRSNENIFDGSGNIVGKRLESDSKNKLGEYKFAFDTMIYYAVNDGERNFYNAIIVAAKLLVYTYFL